MIDGSEKHNRQLAFELQNSHVSEKRSKTIFVLSPPTPQSGRVKLASFMSQSLRSRALRNV